MEELVVYREGKCRGCGACCYELGCRHFDPVARSCLIYDRRAEPCAECGHDHAVCIAWPVYPVQFAKPFCGYRFKVRGTDLEVIRMETVRRE